MIVVSLARTWPLVLKGDATPEVATQASWPVRIGEPEQLDEFADVIVGVFRERVVTAFEITDRRWETPAETAAAVREGLSRENPRVVFSVAPSEVWTALIGQPNPGRPFTKWPVQYLETASVTLP